MARPCILHGLGEERSPLVRHMPPRRVVAQAPPQRAFLHLESELTGVANCPAKLHYLQSTGAGRKEGNLVVLGRNQCALFLIDKCTTLWSIQKKTQLLCYVVCRRLNSICLEIYSHAHPILNRQLVTIIAQKSHLIADSVLLKMFGKNCENFYPTQFSKFAKHYNNQNYRVKTTKFISKGPKLDTDCRWFVRFIFGQTFFNLWCFLVWEQFTPQKTPPLEVAIIAGFKLANIRWTLWGLRCTCMNTWGTQCDCCTF